MAPTQLKFKCITATERLKAIDNLENKNRSGHNKQMKLTKNVLGKLLTLISNQILATDIFPDVFKNPKLSLISKGVINLY